MTNKTLLTRAIIEQLPKLQYIGVLATGYNVIDLQAARERKIPVTNVPKYSTASVAQMVFALLLELTRHVGLHAEAVRAGRWSNQAESLTMGIVGLGAIGQSVAKLAQAFGMSVLAFHCRCHLCRFRELISAKRCHQFALPLDTKNATSR
ncbi:MAG: NAD(P)-dependent oxidoreductase [Pseudomonadota bacterium]